MLCHRTRQTRQHSHGICYHPRMLETFIANGAAWFSAAALIGTGVFLIRLVVLLLGGGHDGDISTDTDTSTGLHEHDTMAGLLSVQGAAAFAMGFGWAGLLARSGFDLGVPASIASGMGGGIVMCLLLALLLRGVRGMQSSGNFQLSQTVGLEGEVYTDIPPANKGRGQVRVVVSGRQRILQAIADASPDTIATGARVKVVRVGSDNTVFVTRS